MAHRGRTILLGLVALLASGTGLAQQQAGRIGAAAELGRYLQSYHANPRPDLMDSALHEFDVSGLASNANAKAAFMMSFSCIFSQSSDRQRAGWSTTINALHEPAKGVLIAAMTHTPGQILAATPISATKNDENWAAYFATGDVRYVDNVIGVLEFMDQRKDLDLFLAASSAEWSLADVSRRDPVVMAQVKATAQSTNPVVRRVGTEIQLRTPELIKAEMVAIVKQQHAAGIW